MSTSTMWLLLFVVVALALLVAALTKTKFTVQKISIIGVMAALSLVAYEFFRIPNVFGSGSSFHLGNTFTALTAMLLDGVSGGLAGAIGLALADILAGDPGYAITTFILKFIIGLVCGFVAHKVIHLKDYPTANRGKYLLVVTASAFSGLLVNVFTDPFIGYFRNRFIFGQPGKHNDQCKNYKERRLSNFFHLLVLLAKPQLQKQPAAAARLPVVFLWPPPAVRTAARTTSRRASSAA